MPTPSLIIPSAPVYDEGLLYGLNVYGTNFVPEPIPFTRATTATRTNAAGLIELAPYNLIRYSEQFDNAAWEKNNSSVIPNISTAPNGTLTADKIIPNLSGSVRGVFVFGNPINYYNFSVYAKAGGKNFLYFYVVGSTASTGVWFNLSTGTIGTIGSSWSGVAITSVGDGWYRCSANVSLINSSNNLYYFVSDTNGSLDVTANGSDGLFLWGAQLVEGTAALPYLKTETRLNRPRVDFSLGGCPNLLLEPQRTNLIQRSEEFDNATWVKLNATVTPNTTISPSGIQNADRIQITNATSNYIDNASSSLLTNGATYTVSVYARSFGATNQSFRIYGNGNKVSPTLTATPNWQRFEYTFTATSTTTGCGIGSPSISDIVVWGYQLEAGTYPTTYIPTTAASVTRNADSFIQSNVFSRGMITAAGGTWFVELRGNVARTREGAFNDVIYLGDSNNSGTGNCFRFWASTNSRFIIQKFITGAATSLFTTTADTCKIAIKWNGATADVFQNGVKVVSATAFTATSLNFLNGGAQQLSAFINQMSLYPTPLSDGECILITS